MNVYENKREFVETLNPALLMIAGVEAVKYEVFSDKYAEYMRITWEGGYKEYIDVTGDSLTAMLSELSKLLSDRQPIGLIKNNEHRNIIERWFRTIEEKRASEGARA